MSLTPPEIAEPLVKEPGRGTALIVYGLFLGSVMAVITAPIGVTIAHLRRGRVAGWLDSHLRFQIRTFWLGLAGGGLGLGIWQLLGWLQLPAATSWAFGYLFFTACLVWMVGRCGVGLHRLLANRPIANPASLAFGGAAVTLAG
ncbi:DUF4870 family protein [Halomonas nitroreducens]|uniref:Uncharacterized protein n=1 Tax=Halomonas nitroreducens TaxID=447425 RepID=A0A431V4T7_9GAMM|nr:hypothetical protein [Halomonas nitroreducens]RTR04498.1 hypothetical protein EKG36_09310 [Halomonas nitroreducens]